jgi:hypothetical protein
LNKVDLPTFGRPTIATIFAIFILFDPPTITADGTFMLKIYLREQRYGFERDYRDTKTKMALP